MKKRGPPEKGKEQLRERKEWISVGANKLTEWPDSKECHYFLVQVIVTNGFGVQCCSRPGPKLILSRSYVPELWGARHTEQFLMCNSSGSIMKWLCLYYFSHPWDCFRGMYVRINIKFKGVLLFVAMAFWRSLSPTHITQSLKKT